MLYVKIIAIISKNIFKIFEIFSKTRIFAHKKRINIMSIQRINQYYRELANIQYSTGTKKESSIRRPFANLLSYYGELKKLNFVDEVKLKNLRKVPDGALVGKAEVKYGYWEAKDLQDDLEKEIINKTNIGYPTFNIIFENSKEAVLI